MNFLLIDGQGIYTFISSKKVSSIGTSLSPPLGILYIGRALEDEGHEVEVIQLSNEKSPEETLKKSLKSSDAVGIGITSKFHKNAFDIAQTIREFDPSLKIFAGGPHCTFHPEKTLNDVPMIDMCLEGEGDFAIKDVAKALEGTKKLSDVPGLFYREKNTIKKGKSHRIIKDLDSIPFPARHLVDKYNYGKVNDVYLFKPKLTSLLTSRGCPFSCRFCSRHALTYKTYRQRSAENVVKELVELNGIYKSVYIVDDNFLVDKKRAHKIMDDLIEIGTNINLLVMGARVDSAERELYKKMKKAGVKYIEFGIESGDQSILDFYNKNITLNQIRTAVNLSREMNFVTTGSFIIGAPLETREQIEKTTKFASSLPLDIVIFYPLVYTYGSDLWNEAVEAGLIRNNDHLSLWADSDQGLGNFSRADLEKMCYKAVKNFYLRPSYVARQFVRSILRKDFGVLKAGMNYL